MASLEYTTDDNGDESDSEVFALIPTSTSFLRASQHGNACDDDTGIDTDIDTGIDTDVVTMMRQKRRKQRTGIQKRDQKRRREERRLTKVLIMVSAVAMLLSVLATLAYVFHNEVKNAFRKSTPTTPPLNANANENENEETHHTSPFANRRDDHEEDYNRPVGRKNPKPTPRPKSQQSELQSESQQLQQLHLKPQSQKSQQSQQTSQQQHKIQQQPKSFSGRKEKQIRNYKDGSALMLSFHAVHHGGTSFCDRIGRHGIHGDPAPSFACMGDNDHLVPQPPELCEEEFDPFCYTYEVMSAEEKPWWRNQTGFFIERIRPYFHMISWEFGGVELILEYNHRSIQETHWENDRLMSVAVTRDPISRMMAGDSTINIKYAGITEDALGRKEWWDFAVYDDMPHTDNFFLRMMNGKMAPERTEHQKEQLTNHIAEGIDRSTEEMMDLFPTGITEIDFEEAKAMLDRFTIVLDISCLDAGIDALAQLLGLEVPPVTKIYHPKPSNRERIGHDDVYEYLLEKNKWDIALYEYSKTISLIQCDSLEQDGNK